MDETPRLQWKQALITLAVALVVAFILNWGILKLFGEKSPYRAEHGLVGIALLMGFVFIHPAKEGNSAKAVGFFAFALIPSYLGTVFPDLDIRLCGIGCHRNPLFHSGLSFLILLCLVRHQGVFLQTLAIGYGLGLASHLWWDVVDYGDVRWLPGGTLDRLWLTVNGLLVLIEAWRRVLNFKVLAAS
ncbi:MAG: DUF5942 domain-containing protein [bacterium]|nr:DUF5942 domain-containing protein [bacterium]